MIIRRVMALPARNTATRLYTSRLRQGFTREIM